jgi:succinoglycan biosynthesis transport protein ExoP
MALPLNASRIMLQKTLPNWSTQRLKLAVGIATLGRREVLSETINVLASQKRLPDYLVISPVNPEDIDLENARSFPAQVEILFGPAGLPVQRNRILAACSDADVIVFFDDDFFAEAEYLSEVEKTFLENPGLIGLTGAVIADGITGPGISPGRGLEILRGTAAGRASSRIYPVAGTYGCNMAFLLAPIRSNAIQFDENLPLYGWQEDTDFSRRVARHGGIAKCEQLIGVHLGIKGGRTSGVRLGYSQVANLIYLLRKRSVSIGYAVKMISRNLLANHLKLVAPEPWIDRRGRCKGNWIAIFDFIRRRDDPRRILTL